MKDSRKLLEEYVGLIVAEKRVREADVTGGGRVPHGSRKHVRDLEQRIASLEAWRDRQKRGSEARASYARLVARLKGELASARRAADRKKGLRENYATEPDDDDVERWQRLLARPSSDETFNSVVRDVRRAGSIDELDDVRRRVASMRSRHEASSTLSRGFMDWLYARRAEELGYEVRRLK